MRYFMSFVRCKIPIPFSMVSIRHNTQKSALLWLLFYLVLFVCLRCFAIDRLPTTAPPPQSPCCRLVVVAEEDCPTCWPCVSLFRLPTYLPAYRPSVLPRRLTTFLTFSSFSNGWAKRDGSCERRKQMGWVVVAFGGAVVRDHVFSFLCFSFFSPLLFFPFSPPFLLPSSSSSSSSSS